MANSLLFVVYAFQKQGRRITIAEQVPVSSIDDGKRRAERFLKHYVGSAVLALNIDHESGEASDEPRIVLALGVVPQEIEEYSSF
ncbi:hypothetical protein [Roseibium sp. M-1]